MLKYRTDIDGLRALAILPVVLFHCGFSRLAPGGFVGVDVFFVISGYLITRIVYTDISNGNYSILDFYKRRILRIFPALLAVFMFCWMAAIALFFKSELNQLGKSIAASAVFASNIYFFTQSGYFFGNLDRNPLLHTWSLSVEEQFYILMPVVLLLLRGAKARTVFILLTGLALASFVLSWQQLTVDRSAAFYLLPSRGWEILLGSLLAMGAVRQLNSRIFSEYLCILGLMLIIGSVLLLSPLAPFPGPGALAACLGTAAVLYAGVEHRTTVYRLLSLRPARYIGLVSYSLYIWHWPIIVFVETVHPITRDRERLAVVVLCFIVAAFSERFIERPFRRPYKFATRTTVGFGVASIAAMIALATLLNPVGQMLIRAAPEADRMLAYEAFDNEALMRSDSCFLTPRSISRTEFQTDTCMKLSQDKKNYLIIGDSHAAHLYAGLSEAHPRINFLQATAAGCHPVLAPNAWGIRRCNELINHVLNKFVPTTHLDGVVLSAEWGREELVDLQETVHYLKRYVGDVVIAGPSPEYDMTLPRILALALRDGHDPEEFARQHRKSYPQETDAYLSNIVFPEGSRYVSVYRILCPSECILTLKGDPILFDRDHLMHAGSVFVGQQFSFDVDYIASAEP